MSFGKWYEEKKAEENSGGDEGAASSSWFDTESLPLFSTETMQSMSWSNMKASMEAQMPRQILGMGYQQRFKVFCALLFLSALFFALAFFVGLPMIALKPQKFALSFTMGSLTFMGSFAILKGPVEHLQSMLQPDRLSFTFVYLASMFLTLYFTFSFGGASGYLLVIGASVGQLVSLLWYLISFLPGGASGLQYVLAAMAHLLRPVIVACAKLQAMCLAKCFGWLTSSSSSGS
jgi:Got1/Sft2-like family